MALFPYILLIVLSASLLIIWSRWRLSKRADFIRTYMFPPGLLDKLLAVRPDLTIKDRQLVARALRQFFLVYHKSGYQPIAMPSQVVDDLWHEFILYTKNYQTFCQQAFGRATASKAVYNQGLKNVVVNKWKLRSTVPRYQRGSRWKNQA